MTGLLSKLAAFGKVPDQIFYTSCGYHYQSLPNQELI